VRRLGITLPTLSDDEWIELEMYIDFAESQLQDPESEKIREFFALIRQRSQEIKDARWRNNPKNWGACSKWPYEDDFPF
jgi:hypothetical protein